MITECKIEAAFFDVDGTLLSFNTHKVPESALNAINCLRDNGIRIFIATGRSASNLKEIAAVPYDVLIAMNGTDITLRNGMVIAHHAIPEDVFSRFIEFAGKYDAVVSLEASSGVFVSRITSRVEAISRMVALDLPQVTDIRNVFEPGVTSQLCLFADIETEKKIMSHFPQLTASRWCDIFADINPAGFDKSTGLLEATAFLGIPAENTIAFGDGGNDIPILKCAGIGVAMGNAADSVKINADFITHTVDENGIDYALRFFGIISD